MAAFGIEQGTHGVGEGRYAAGLITLPDGRVRGIEEVRDIRVLAIPGSGRAEPLDRAGDVVGGLRGALAASSPASLPLRLAFSTVWAGLGVIEQGLKPPPSGSIVEIAFCDGAALTGRMPPETVALLRRDVEIAQGILARREVARPVAPEPAPVVPAPRPAPPRPAPPALPAPATAEPVAEAGPLPDEALTSIFRYEKRNGRLRRVAVPTSMPEG